MFIASQLHANATTWDDCREIAQLMDAGTWHSLWVPDHFVPPEAFLDETGDNFEGWTLLTALAAATQRIRLGVLVTGNTYRNPALLAKIAATLDHISGGRLELGIGAAWHEREHRAYGWDFPAIRERSDRLEEACALIKALFTADGPVDFAGQYYRLEQAPFAPKCLQQPHLPIMVGGGGERRTLRTLAQYGDMMNVGGTPEDVARKIEVLTEHCAAVGRDPGEITKTAFGPVGVQDDEGKAAHLRELWRPNMSPEERWRNLAIGPADHVIEVLKSYEAAGLDGWIFQGVPNQPRFYHTLSEEVLPAFT